VRTDSTNPQEFFFTTELDHFDNGGHMDNFQIRYLIDDTYWKPESGPILFYAGNEGDIYDFYYNVGFMTETIAQETGGLLVFGEHRYFGESFPFDPSVAFNSTNNVYLTVHQAMEDYVQLIKFIRQEYNMQDKACVTFGGSYGGMLAGWLRMKYPHTFQGALAASAPILYFEGAPTATMYGFSDITTNDFRVALDKAPELIKEAFTSLVSTAQRPAAWDQVSSIFNTCTPITSALEVSNLYYHLNGGY
jgi:lysosomal Pro-X carboxypeptidase